MPAILHKKAPIWSGLFFILQSRADLKSADVLIQAGFIPGSLVAMHKTFAHRAIKRRHGCLVSGFGRTLVAGFDSGKHFLNAGANVRTLAGIAQTVFFCLTGTLAC